VSSESPVILGITDLDDMLEELDPEFQKSLKVAAKEYRAGKAISLREYVVCSWTYRNRPERLSVCAPRAPSEP